MAVKIIGLDLDGTLINKEHGISPRTREALTKAAERGIHIVPVTGRPLSGLPDFINGLSEIEYTITSNGSSVWQDGKTIMSHRFPSPECAALLRSYNGSCNVIEVFIDGQGYDDELSFDNLRSQFMGTPIMDYFAKSRRVVPDMIEFLEADDIEIEELSIMFESTEQCEHMLEVLKAYPALKAVRPMPAYLEIISADAGKGNALTELGAKLGIKPEEIMALGDSDNDSEMLKSVGYPVAMGNADKKLKQIARFVTADNGNDGVALAIDKFVFGTEVCFPRPAVIFLDVDGTIIDIDGNVPPSAREAIQRAQEKGNICVINTGRPYAHVVDSVKALGIKGYICACGQYISLDGKVLKNVAFDAPTSQTIIKKAKECRVDLFIESENGLFHSFVHPISPRMNAEFDRFRRRGFDVDAPVETESFCFSKVCAWEYDDSRMKEFLDFSKPYLYPIRREGRMYELVHNGCSKARGIEEFIEYCALEGYDTYAVGDSGNDSEMLACVQHSVAMGNAPDELKAISEYTTADLFDNGLYKAFEHYGLI